MQTRHLPRFRQNPLFSAGDKTTVSQNHRFNNPDMHVTLWGGCVCEGEFQFSPFPLCLCFQHACPVMVPLRPKLLHYIPLVFRIDFPNYVINLYITELVSDYFLGHVISGVVGKHTMWTSDYIT